jgi:hypothetical protein
MRLTWKREPNETGLRSVDQGERSHKLRLNGQGDVLASVCHSSPNAFFPDRPTGWYWTCGKNKELGIEWKNTCNEPLFETPEEAKKECKAYILKALKEAKC